jgi:N-acylneuraminate cytidylyltransferase
MPLKKNMAKSKKDQMSTVKLFLTDVDGCLTDGGMYYSADGEVIKRFCVYDGMGMVLLKKAGIPCGIITSEDTVLIRKRAQKLKIDFLYLNAGSQLRGGISKKQAAERICNQLGITLEDVCYIGDDLNDLDLLRAVGHPCCPPNARRDVLSIPGIRILDTPGGQGAIREAADLILQGIIPEQELISLS